MKGISNLKAQGQPIGTYDLLIAARALSHNLLMTQPSTIGQPTPLLLPGGDKVIP